MEIINTHKVGQPLSWSGGTIDDAFCAFSLVILPLLVWYTNFVVVERYTMKRGLVIPIEASSKNKRAK